MKPSNRLLLSLIGAVALAGCGGGGSGKQTGGLTLASPTTATSAADPGRQAIDAFAAAARAGRADALWSMLSTPTRQRLGPLARFRTHAAVELAEGVGGFGRFDVIVSERITPEFGVVAIDGSRIVEGRRERSVFATALRLEGNVWKIELRGPVHVRPIGPDPGAHEDVVAQVAAAVSGQGGNGTAVVYVDGAAESPRVYGTATTSTVVVNFEPALDRGRHTVVVFGSVGRQAAATGWWFTVARTPKR